MNQQRETGKSVSHLGHNGRDWLSGLNWPGAEGQAVMGGWSRRKTQEHKAAV